MSHFIFLEDTSIVFSTLRCMRLEKLGFEQDRINHIISSKVLVSISTTPQSYKAPMIKIMWSVLRNRILPLIQHLNTACSAIKV